MYQQWLLGVDEVMARQGRHILLLVDNASSHDETGLCLAHVRVEKLPPNTTAKIQPMDQGIIYCVKPEVLTQKMMHALGYIGQSNEDAYKTDLFTAMQWCETAWGNVSSSTIQKCWLHSTLISKSSVSFLLN
ncbi:hypothetical protein PC116_g20597 [Phytophthora cactorum]|uniref:DDE-1 domain-containing protein n=1 Tax=Phytophthora cactorum TaxID=29920 RepID=A0A8T1K312_9STRA|nr:hypothetical protein PC114_g22195 [Phytophthora cactorum]KAG2917095.1 hypothetical protein PC117_g17544 [Phytophthora cactorum]KAG2974450.1 hypothetical protein PC119_g22693 [Phytophthora cactorum]KAG3169489.1 hypothetical protein PC128_g19132 [Phytophthora cactorum]KAG4231123.1 hypothetical protein PC116_g20597 [Phytophthora cactorum]